jgi:hypothetical protein
MDIGKLISQTSLYMQRNVDDLASRVEPPELIEVNGHQAFRYKEQTIHQAVVLKLARLVSNLNAARVLLEQGFVQEQGAIQRMLDEGNEDIVFLSCGVISDDIGDLHKKFLEAFWEEEFDNPSPLKSTQKRQNIPRSKINAWIARNELSDIDESKGVALTTTIHKTYSGYVHGAATHILDMYGGNPPHFHMAGMNGTPRVQEHAEDLLNYYFRAISSFAVAAKAFGDEALFKTIYGYAKEFTRITGKG